jgi:divalent metal cation (Fe/Co/Zn/Cd) transporter
MTFLDGCLASGVLVALVLNLVWGFWWADPAAACLVAAFCLREAIDNWRESRYVRPIAAERG